jgi:8-oxo-dGTP diphosphatase
LISDSRLPIPDSRLVEVVAGVLQDASGRILLARRTEGRDLAGLWEFPGGKVEADETPEASLVRELREELGVEVEVGASLIRVPQQYPHKRLRLDVRRIVAWRGGTPKGREGQALAWVPRQKLSSYAMPSADRPVVAALLQPDRYLVTPSPDVDAQWLASLQLAIDRGVERVQLRASPAIDRARWRTLVLEARTRCRIAGVEVLLNTDIDLARELDIGVHLRGEQLRELRQRPLPDGLPIAASCHDLDELRRAEELRCDFAVLGPLQRTPTHPEATGIGWDAFATLREHVSLPIYAIGGMTQADIATARTHGAQGIAAIRALWPTPLL